MSHNHQLNIIKQKWTELHNKPGVFRYNLNILSRKCLPGKYNIYAELNSDRTKLRRIPQVIPSLFTKFDHNKFNFNQIKPEEKLLDIPFDDIIVTFIVNQSPITVYHSLICPDLEKCHPQFITEKSLEFCIEFLLSTDERGFRIGYNSPGALASVNHLHLHLLFWNCDLYIDKAELELIGKSGAYKFSNTMPTEAICFLIDNNNKQSILRTIHKLISFICDHNLPHNIFIAHDRTQKAKRLKLFIYARDQHYAVKDTSVLNAGFCEFSGYVTVGDSELYNNLTEQRVLEKLKSESGNVYTLIYNYLKEL